MPELGSSGSTVEFVETPASTTLTESLAPAHVGRYLVEGTLGRGGMGIVFAAFDPELDRRVALKLLRPDRSGVLDDDEWRRRLLGEARALAQLSDPNVVQVFDLGTHDGAVYVAMELVTGCTLAEWLKERPRTLAEILPIFVDAGRGLAAAHAVGIVHRDFKPGNILVGTDGRVRVADFGLAAACSSSTAIATPSSSESDGGVVMGTVGYMAPEQRNAQSTDHRADQYSFCVALHFAIYGEKPEQDARGAAVVCTRSEPPIPGRIRAAIARGLSTDPADRFASMDDLLAAIVHAPGRPRWVIAAGVVIVPFGVFGALASTQPSTNGCRTADDRLAGVWDSDVRTTMTDAFAATGSSYATAATARVVEGLDGWAAAWAQEYAAACTAPVESAARIDCLDLELDRARALTEVLRSPDASVVAHAVDAVLGMRPPADCSGSIDPVGAPPSESLAAVATTRAKLHTAEAQTQAGRFDDAYAGAEQAVRDADAIGWPPLRADALLVLGTLQQQHMRSAEAEATLDQAFWLARECGHERVAMRAATRMIELLGIDLRREEEALRWAREAEAAMQRHGGDTDTEIGILIGRASVFDLVGRSEEARVDFERALALDEATRKSDATSATIHNSLGIVALNLGDDAAGKAHLEKAIEIAEASLGPEHPEVALYLLNLGTTHLQFNALAKARPLIERALEIRERAFGPENALTAQALGQLGITADLEGNRAEALELLQRTLGIRERTLAPDHPDIASTHNSLAVVLEGMGQREQARDHLISSLGMLERKLGDSHPELAQLHINLGEFAFQDREWKLAHEHFLRAIELREAAVGPNHRSLADPLYSLAEVELELGRTPDAVRNAERSLALAPNDEDPERHRHRKRLLARAKSR
jgi:tetratricopeptide (TPR) repeat protein